MKKTLLLIIILSASIFTAIPAYAQSRPVSRGGRDGMPGHGRSSLAVNINARVLEDETTVIWDRYESQNTIPGRPVGIKLVGSNIVVAMQFTPFIRRNGSVLVAQGQIWIEDPERGISYFTLLQTIPMEFGEPIHFFPLGANQSLDSSIELTITVNPVEIESNEQ